MGTNLISLVGNTPMVELTRFDTGPCRLFAKLESMNPGGSIKDRIALHMIDAAEQRSDLEPGDTIIEATAGNTGLGLAMVANHRGYRLVVVLPDKMSLEKINTLRNMGAEIRMTRSDVERGHPEYYQDLAATIAEKEGFYYVNQFNNPDNVEAHRQTTGPEIYSQMDGDIDAFVCGVGTSGTLSGAGGYLKSKKPDIDIVLADPQGSILADYVKTGTIPTPGKWLVEGIGEDIESGGERIEDAADNE